MIGVEHDGVRRVGGHAALTLDRDGLISLHDT
jgi:hypothetical protein